MAIRCASGSAPCHPCGFQPTRCRDEDNILRAMSPVPQPIKAGMGGKWRTVPLNVGGQARPHRQRMAVAGLRGAVQTSDSMYSNTTDMSQVPYASARRPKRAWNGMDEQMAQ